MTSHARFTPADPTSAFVSWLVTAGAGPAVAALPVNLVADKLAGAAVRWFKRFRQTDDLSRLVRSAAGATFQLSRDEVRDLRKLLEKEQTWHLLAAGRQDERLKQLTSQIADCLPAQDGRTVQETHAAAEAIARGLLEFAVFELEPKIFQKVVLARLQQMSDQASALDEALFRMHKDLYHLVGAAKELFTLVSDRLPPGRADLNEVKIYLMTLIGWLNADPWPQRLGGPTLTPAAVERKLRVSATDALAEQDADELARQCSRLVILGGPGSGKTWLAMRTARICGEDALAALEAGTTLDEVELPLYTTCSRLVRTPANIGIREAVASSAIARIGDLGGSRILKALCLLFTEQDRRTLLVIDSLDEARDAGEARDRLREADSLRPPWRVVLTSRHSSWNNQLNIQNANPAHRIGDLQPLRYPADVEAVIQQWFANSRPQGQALVKAIARRPGLQQAATVPLVLAFYCILGSDRSLSDDQPLPAFRHKLYRQVIDRMLQGPWHSGGGRPPDLSACRAVLRTWAWPGMKENHLVSGVGQWEDDIPTEDVSLSSAGQIAVDHIAAPSGGPGFDADETLRRFVHRSLREQLVAEHVAGLMAVQAVQELLPHLWYDPDWEYTAPAALAMHPQRDRVLKELLRRVAGGGQLPGDLAAIDGCWEIRRFLARVAQESGEGEWPPEAAGMIGQARLDLATSRRSDLREVVARDWPTSNRPIIESLLGQLAGETHHSKARELAEAVAGLDPSSGDRARARDAMLALLKPHSNEWPSVHDVVGLAVTPAERAQARDDLLTLLVGDPNSSVARWLVTALTTLAVTAEDRADIRYAFLALLTSRPQPSIALRLAETVAGLDPSPEDRARVREALLTLLVTQTNAPLASDLAEAAAKLDPSPENRARVREALLALLAAQTQYVSATWLIPAITALVVTSEDRARTREALFPLLASKTDFLMIQTLANSVVELAVTPEDRTSVREALLALLVTQTDPLIAKELAHAAAKLSVIPKDLMRAREALLALLVTQTHHWYAQQLAETIAGLKPSAQDRALARKALFALLATHDSFLAPNLANATSSALAALALTPEDRAQTREALLTLLDTQTDPEVARGLAETIAGLKPSAEDRAQTRDALLALLDSQTGPWGAIELAEAVARLDPSPEDRARARETLFTLLATQTDFKLTRNLTAAVAVLAVTPEDRAQTRDVLLALLATQTERMVADSLAKAVAVLAVTPEDRAQTRDALLGLLATQTDSWQAHDLAKTVARLDPTPEDQARARQALLALLATQTDLNRAHWLANEIAALDPSAEDRAGARKPLLALLASQTESWQTSPLEPVAKLAVTPEDRARSREALLSILDTQTSLWRAHELTKAIAELDPTAEDRARVSEALLALVTTVTTQPNSWWWLTPELAEAVAKLAVTPEDRAATRNALLALLLTQTNSWLARDLANVIAQLNPTVADLCALDNWPFSPPAALLAAVRRNTGVLAWLAALPRLPRTTDS